MPVVEPLVGGIVPGCVHRQPTRRSRALSTWERDVPGDRNWRTLHTAVLGLWLLSTGLVPAWALDLENAVIVSPPGGTGPEKKAVRMLIEEVEKRGRVQWPESALWPAANNPVVAVGSQSLLKDFAGPWLEDLQKLDPGTAPEGFRICVRKSQTNSAVYVIGNDARGVLFGCGRLLRELHLRPGVLKVDDNLNVATAPRYRLRGHQLGYRPKCNSYDAWDLPQWEQYYRDLIVFGCNAIELIPPRSDDDADSPHFPRPQVEMMTGMSRIADSYGLDVWIWYPAMDKDYSDPKTVEFALKEWGAVFAKLPRVDAVFVPGGDPGHTQPKHLMALLAKQTENLHRYHPKAQMWVSPQSFDQGWLEEFLGILNHEHPAWLSGVVFGPQVRISLPRLRELVPRQYPIRHYPDITHSRQCQYPVPDWDVAYALTEARECINPRPVDESMIFRKTQPQSIGFISYSEGCNDDVNKAVWSALGWDPDLAVADILRQFGRYFIGERQEEGFAQGLLALELNWRGSLLANAGVETTLAQFQSMERSATPGELKNWRFQQALLRAYYDAYIRQRLIHESRAESLAMECLRCAPASGAGNALAAAEKALDQGAAERVNQDWRARILQLGEALFQSIGMQLSVERYQAIAVDRGAMLDTLDYPLNNRLWLKERFALIRRLTSEPERLQALQEITEWTNPGPGGFYDDLGNPARQPHLLRGPGFQEDPGCFQSARSGFEEDLVVDEPDENPGVARRVAWMDHAESLYDAPLSLLYRGLDPKVNYKLRVLYGGDSPKRKIRLMANQFEVHPYLHRPFPYKPIEFPIPPAATQGGELTLNWFGESGLGGNGRGCQVSEVWLIVDSPARPR
jgi:hypothetical protein